MRPNIAETWILGSGMGALLVAALVVNLIVPQFEDMFRGFGAELPWLTAVFARHRHLFFLLPLLPPLLWWAMARHAGASPQARRKLAVLALLLALGLTFVMVPLTIIAMYLPIFGLAGVVDG